MGSSHSISQQTETEDVFKNPDEHLEPGPFGIPQNELESSYQGTHIISCFTDLDPDELEKYTKSIHRYNMSYDISHVFVFTKENHNKTILTPHPDSTLKTQTFSCAEFTVIVISRKLCISCVFNAKIAVLTFHRGSDSTSNTNPNKYVFSICQSTLFKKEDDADANYAYDTKKYTIMETANSKENTFQLFEKQKKEIGIVFFATNPNKLAAAQPFFKSEVMGFIEIPDLTHAINILNSLVSLWDTKIKMICVFYLPKTNNHVLLKRIAKNNGLILKEFFVDDFSCYAVSRFAITINETEKKISFVNKKFVIFNNSSSAEINKPECVASLTISSNKIEHVQKLFFNTTILPDSIFMKPRWKAAASSKTKTSLTTDYLPRASLTLQLSEIVLTPHSSIEGNFISVHPIIKTHEIYNVIQKWKTMFSQDCINIFKVSDKFEFPQEIKTFMEDSFEHKFLGDGDDKWLYIFEKAKSISYEDKGGYAIFKINKTKISFVRAKQETNIGIFDLIIIGKKLGKEDSVEYIPCSAYSFFPESSVQEYRKQYLNKVTTVSIADIKYDHFSKTKQKNLFIFKRNLSIESLGDWMKALKEIGETKGKYFLVASLVPESFNIASLGQFSESVKIKEFTLQSQKLVVMGYVEPLFTTKNGKFYLTIALPSNITWEFEFISHMFENGKMLKSETSSAYSLQFDPRGKIPMGIKKSMNVKNLFGETFIANISYQTNFTREFSAYSAIAFYHTGKTKYATELNDNILKFLKNKESLVFSFIRNLDKDIIPILLKDINSLMKRLESAVVLVFQCNDLSTFIPPTEIRFVSQIIDNLQYFVISKERTIVSIKELPDIQSIEILAVDAALKDRKFYICESITSISDKKINRETGGIMTKELYVPPQTERNSWNHADNVEYVYIPLDLKVFCTCESFIDGIDGLSIIFDKKPNPIDRIGIKGFTDHGTEIVSLVTSLNMPPFYLLNELKHIIVDNRKKRENDKTIPIVYRALTIFLKDVFDDEDLLRFRIPKNIISQFLMSELTEDGFVAPLEETEEIEPKKGEEWTIDRIKRNHFLITNARGFIGEDVIRFNWFRGETEYTFPVFNSLKDSKTEWFKILLNFNDLSFDDRSFSSSITKFSNNNMRKIDDTSYSYNILMISSEMKHETYQYNAESDSTPEFLTYMQPELMGLFTMSTDGTFHNFTRSISLLMKPTTSQHMIAKLIERKPIDYRFFEFHIRRAEYMTFLFKNISIPENCKLPQYFHQIKTSQNKHIVFSKLNDIIKIQGASFEISRNTFNQTLSVNIEEKKPTTVPGVYIVGTHTADVIMEYPGKGFLITHRIGTVANRPPLYEGLGPRNGKALIIVDKTISDLELLSKYKIIVIVNSAKNASSLIYPVYGMFLEHDVPNPDRIYIATGTHVSELGEMMAKKRYKEEMETGGEQCVYKKHSISIPANTSMSLWYGKKMEERFSQDPKVNSQDCTLTLFYKDLPSVVLYFKHPTVPTIPNFSYRIGRVEGETFKQGCMVIAKIPQNEADENVKGFTTTYQNRAYFVYGISMPKKPDNTSIFTKKEFLCLSPPSNSILKST